MGRGVTRYGRATEGGVVYKKARFALRAHGTSLSIVHGAVMIRGTGGQDANSSFCLHCTETKVADAYGVHELGTGQLPWGLFALESDHLVENILPSFHCPRISLVAIVMLGLVADGTSLTSSNSAKGRGQKPFACRTS